MVLKFITTWIFHIFLDFGTNIILDFHLESFCLIFCGLTEICSFEVNKNQPKIYRAFLLTMEVLVLLCSESNRWYFRGQKDLLPVQKLDLSITLT